MPIRFFGLALTISLLLGACPDDELDCVKGFTAREICCTDPSGDSAPKCTERCVATCEVDEDCDGDSCIDGACGPDDDCQLGR